MAPGGLSAATRARALAHCAAKEPGLAGGGGGGVRPPDSLKLITYPADAGFRIGRAPDTAGLFGERRLWHLAGGWCGERGLQPRKLLWLSLQSKTDGSGEE